MKINILKYLLFFGLVITSLTSCLKAGLDDLPAFEDAEIVNVFLEHRFVDSDNVVQFKNLDLTTRIVAVEDSGAQLDSVVITPAVPLPSGTFTTAERLNVTLDNIVAYADISTAAKIEPLDGAPKLGLPGNFSQVNKYRVTAADGTSSRDWVVVVKPLPEINEYEGLYAETGTLVRIGNPADVLDADVYLQTINANTVKAQAGTSVFNNPGITFLIQVNADNTVTINSDPDALVAIYQQAGKPSTYDPATKTFDLHYAYRNGDRLFDTKLVLK